MSKVKPLIISRTLPYLGGREVMVDKIIEFFNKKNGVSVLTPDKYPNKNVSIYPTDQDFTKILEWVKTQDVTVINCHTFYLADLAIYLSKELKLPLVFTLHGVFIDYYGKKYGSLLKKIYKNSDLVITVSDHYRNNLGDFIGDSKKILTIKNGIDLKIIDRVNKSKTHYQNKHKIPHHKFVVIIPARLNYIKGLDYLIKAINQISTNQFLFIICSPKGRKNDDEVVYKNKLKAVLKKKSLLKFRYLNNLELYEYYRVADLVLLPSLIEGISISLLEAMACSKTIVATNVGGNPEIIKNNINGYLIDSKNPESILKSVSGLESIKNKKIGRNARVTIEDNFSIDQMFRQYYKVFNEIKYENK